MDDVIIYTQNDCPPCTFVKNYLTEHNVEYEERNISNNQYRLEMMDYDAFSTPFILLKGKPMYQVDLDEINSILKIDN
ncbi:glutaredoxin family protein [Staphylococcus simiae]|uniref:Glutaredoxin domain-containing protein n=1 Tax=Staphylococcus simiae CCM 7213 = CCUG 51256 TaxID=911238 RepID=G5JM52_9STAP|nr:glutaredoxin family protein [Staphylococcus simiae]EHJ06748.1 hypothetical protein SS7213T_12877 [Staphylococcus simiae CCM 7213 = CCUG 51256]PNZ13648.1 glutaredoxin family protein [Staphylococcus simiae]SNV68072.1 putative glutaredoxin [Staphylococcus simiae]